MMLFSEIYGCYYQVVAAVLDACQSPQKADELYDIVNASAFRESALFILPKLLSGQWDLLTETPQGYQAKIKPTPLPLTLLERRFLKTLLADERIGLFLTDTEKETLNQFLGDCSPLYRHDDFLISDQSRDGDPYHSEDYRQHFRQCLAAIEQKRLLCVSLGNNRKYILPQRLEYSAKDDKFRLHGLAYRKHKPKAMAIINIARITAITPLETITASIDWNYWQSLERAQTPITIEIFNERNALERCMLHFAKYEKRTEYDEQTKSYRCDIYYAAKDETELLIQLLSFGPVIRVLGPEAILTQIRARLRKQQQLFENAGSAEI